MHCTCYKTLKSCKRRESCNCTIGIMSEIYLLMPIHILLDYGMQFFILVREGGTRTGNDRHEVKE